MNSECGCADHQRTSLSRRALLGRTLAAGAAGAFAGLVGDQLATQLAFAADPSYTGDVLVLLSLRGGFDGLSAVVPAGDSAYYAARPGIGVPKAQLIGSGSMFGLNPALAPLLPFWQNKTLGAVHAVGQPAPNRSHFAAMETLEASAPGTGVRTGWLDRMLGGLGAKSPLNGIAVGSAVPARVMAGPSPDLNLGTIDDFKLAGDDGKLPLMKTIKALHTGAPAMLSRSAAQVGTALDTTKRLAGAKYQPANGATYPDNDLGKALRDVARLIKGNVGLMTASVDSGDWDMHQNVGQAVKGQQMYDHLNALAVALAAFATDLGPAGLSKVTLLTVSEFGRRVEQNGSNGLDHGYGNSMFVLGGNVNGGQVHGKWPGLSSGDLVDGDLAVTTDYRTVIGEILTKRCGLKSMSTVFPGASKATLGVVRA